MMSCPPCGRALAESRSCSVTSCNSAIDWRRGRAKEGVGSRRSAPQRRGDAAMPQLQRPNRHRAAGLLLLEGVAAPAPPPCVCARPPWAAAHTPQLPGRTRSRTRRTCSGRGSERGLERGGAGAAAHAYAGATTSGIARPAHVAASPCPRAHASRHARQATHSAAHAPAHALHRSAVRLDVNDVSWGNLLLLHNAEQYGVLVSDVQGLPLPPPPLYSSCGHPRCALQQQRVLCPHLPAGCRGWRGPA